MAHITINQYLQQLFSFQTLQVYEAIDTRDGSSLAELVSFKHPHVANPRLQMASPEEKCQQVLEPPYDEMFAAHLRCTYAVGNHDFIEAYKCQTVIVQSFLRAFQAHKEENWALPVMYAVALDLRIFANNADQQLVKKGKSKVGDMLEKAAELLMSCFRVCASDTRAGIEDSKKWGMLFLVNQLFKIYFKINKLHLCKPLIRAIDSSNLKDDYSTAQRVTYRYYVGRKAMFDSDFKQALPPFEPEEQKDGPHLSPSCEDAPGSHANRRAPEEVPSHAVCGGDQSCERRQPPPPERGSGQARDLLHPVRHFPHPREAEDYHLQEPL
ncbi:PCI domain-containing protein 2 isoform X3 [Orcinus orca]|uniref:PCI domain-containing protein 2 isoform X3 n=1 Tax=Orcinus orca TaxID=9733 RepID=UPI0021126683|nr:PCI domain-containing protein 2 isoform X3 [Orcinus orca]